MFRNPVVAAVVVTASLAALATHLVTPFDAQSEPISRLNDDCQPTTDQMAYRVDQTLSLKHRGENWRLRLARFQDGAALFCLTQQKNSQHQRVDIESLQNQFIDAVTPTGPGTSVFEVVVRSGNGRGAAQSSLLLDLRDPIKPQLWRPASGE